MGISSAFKDHMPAILLLAASALIAYGSSLGYYFVSDDFHWLHRAVDASLSDIVKEYLYLPGFRGPQNIYRPNQDLFFTLNYMLFGPNPLPYRLEAFFLYALDAFMVYYLFYAVTRRRLTALLGGIFYAFSVSNFSIAFWLSSISELQALFFMLASFVLYINKRGILSVTAFVLALLSKETALALPLILLVYEAAVNRPSVKNGVSAAAKRLWPYFTLFAAFLFFRLYFSGVNRSGPYAAALGMNVLENLKVYFMTLSLFFYWSPEGGIGLIAPVRAHYIGMSLLLGFLAACIYLAVGSRAFRGRLVFGVLYYAAGLTVFLPMVKHWYLYYIHTASVGFFFLLAAAYSEIHDRLEVLGRRGRGAGAALVGLVVAGYIANSVMFCGYWEDKSPHMHALTKAGNVAAMLKKGYPALRPGSDVVIFMDDFYIVSEYLPEVLYNDGTLRALDGKSLFPDALSHGPEKLRKSMLARGLEDAVVLVYEDGPRELTPP